MDDAGVREIREHYRGEIATLRAEVERLTSQLVAAQEESRQWHASWETQTERADLRQKDLARIELDTIRPLREQLAAVTRERDEAQRMFQITKHSNQYNYDMRLELERQLTALEEAGEAMRLDFGNPQTHERWRQVRGGGHELGM